MRCIAALAGALAGCGGVSSGKHDAGADADAPAQLGSKDNPAHSCDALKVAAMPSGAYWLLDPGGAGPAFLAYCEQELNGGGWVMLENSVRRDDGATATFWQFGYADRLKTLGMPAPDQNYYAGSLYQIGRQYMDVFVDLQGKTAVAALMTAKGINPSTMQFMSPVLTGGNAAVFANQFAAGWSALDFDGDAYDAGNCAVSYNNIAQHYSGCWSYNLGADADTPTLDGGVGPHVENGVLASLSLAAQPSGGAYSQVARIARFTRW